MARHASMSYPGQGRPADAAGSSQDEADPVDQGSIQAKHSREYSSGHRESRRKNPPGKLVMAGITSR